MNLDKLILLVSLYSGGAILALLILAVGWRAAKGRGAVIAFAIAAAICLTLQAIVLWAISDMGRGWGGDAIDAPTAIGGSATLAGFLTLLAFVTRRLEEKPSTRDVEKSRLRMAAVLVVLWIVLGLSNSMRYAAAMGISHLIRQPTFLIVTAGGLVAAWGLWRSEPWASWLALALGAWQVGRFLLGIPSTPHGPVGWILTVRGIATLALAGAMILVLLDPPWRGSQDAKQT